MFIYGHRGAAGEAPENTLAAVDRGIAAGCDGVEIDVRLADSRVWVLHDASLARTCGRPELIYECSAEALLALGEALALLEAVAARCTGLRLNVELKDQAVAEPALALKPPGADWLVSSFLVPALQRVRARDPDQALALCAESVEALPTALELGCESLHLPLRRVDRHCVERVHAVGLRVLAFTCNQVEEMHRLQAVGCDGIFTDVPSTLKSKS